MDLTLTRPSSRFDEMKRFATSCLLLLLLWALAPGVGEAVENAVHLVLEGHTAHAEPDGDRHTPSGPEHGCTGVMHSCSCCVSQSFLPNQYATLVPTQSWQRLADHDRVQLPTASGGGIDRPPRA